MATIEAATRSSHTATTRHGCRADALASRWVVDAWDSFRLRECLPDILTSADVAVTVRQRSSTILSPPERHAYGQK